MKKPSKKDISKEIKWLKDNKKYIPAFSKFGDNNWAAIEAEIEVLENGFNEEDVFEKYDRQEWTEHQRSSAMNDLNWLRGEEESPSESWGVLVQKGK